MVGYAWIERFSLRRKSRATLTHPTARCRRPSCRVARARAFALVLQTDLIVPVYRCPDMRKHSLVAAFVALLAGTGGIAAQTYPSRPITLVVAFAAGGSGDTIARILADHMRMQLGQTIVVENVGGAAGSIGVGRVARAAPDGYTIVSGNWPTHVLNGAIYNLNYDVLKDFEPISLIATESIVLSTRKDFPATKLSEFIAWLRANPGKASAGTVGPGSVGHIVGLFFQKETGTQFQFVPYRGLA